VRCSSISNKKETVVRKDGRINTNYHLYTDGNSKTGSSAQSQLIDYEQARKHAPTPGKSMSFPQGLLHVIGEGDRLHAFPCIYR
jgi:hypothetical protein